MLSLGYFEKDLESLNANSEKLKVEVVGYLHVLLVEFYRFVQVMFIKVIAMLWKLFY
jgi:hypothetical protein